MGRYQRLASFVKNCIKIKDYCNWDDIVMIEPTEIEQTVNINKESNSKNKYS